MSGSAQGAVFSVIEPAVGAVSSTVPPSDPAGACN